MHDINELTKLNVVKEELITQVNKLSASLKGHKTSVLQARDEMWKEARIVIRDFDDVADLTIFADEVARHEVQYVKTSEDLKKLGKMLDSPYFARIDFIEDGYDEVEEIYIGRFSLFDEKSQSFLVYDWRAPISGLYYDFGVGKASFNVPATGAKISGDINLKRQYQIEKGELLYLFDNDIAIEDDILRKVLSKASDAHIKTIVNTIQADQNKAIRTESLDVLVYGPAGCGKTSVGLHRLAYLLYRHRESLSSGKVRIFSPNAIFASYIEGIIPELGEEDVLTLDFPFLMSQITKRNFKSPFEFIEFLDENPDNVRTKWVQAKFSDGFVSGLEKMIAEFSPTFEDVYFYKDKICDATRLTALYEDRTTAGSLKSKTERVLSYLNNVYKEYYKNNRKQIMELFNSIHDDNFTDYEIEQKFEEEKNITTVDLRNRMLPRSKKILEKYLKKVAKDFKLPIGYAKDALYADGFYYEDAVLLFYVDLLTGFRVGDKTVKHILLDEAQDFSLLHHRILKKMYPSSRFTVLADVNQALFNNINITDTSDLIELYPNAEVIPLTKSYRSTFEIMNFAAKFLGQEMSESFVRHGDEPTIVKNTDEVAAALEIIKNLPEEFNTVGIVLPTIKQAREFYEKIKGFHQVSLIQDDMPDFKPGVMVIAAPFVKGLEFDVVIAPVDLHSSISSSRKNMLMYLICTRALHRLYVIDKNL